MFGVTGLRNVVEEERQQVEVVLFSVQRYSLVLFCSPKTCVYGGIVFMSIVFSYRFINARRRIVQPMIDQSNRAGAFFHYPWRQLSRLPLSLLEAFFFGFN